MYKDRNESESETEEVQLSEAAQAKRTLEEANRKNIEAAKSEIEAVLNRRNLVLVANTHVAFMNGTMQDLTQIMILPKPDQQIT